MRGLLPSLIVLLCMQYATAQWFKFVLSKGMTCEDRCKKRTKMCNPLDEFRDCKCFPRQLVDNGLQLPIDPYLVCRMNWAGVVPKCCDLYKQQEDSNKNSYNQSEMPSRNCNESHEIDELKARLASCDEDGEAGTSNMTAEMFTLLVEQNVKQNMKLEQLEKRLDNQREEIEQLETRYHLTTDALTEKNVETASTISTQSQEIKELSGQNHNQSHEIEQLGNMLTLQNRKHSEAIEQLKDGLSSEQTESVRLSNLTAKMVSSLGEQNQDIEALTQAWSTEPWKQLVESVSASGSIGFTAYLSPNVKFPKFSQIKFDKVLTNDGNGYNPSTGYFTVPVAGTYVFFFAIGGRTSRWEWITAVLYINDVFRVKALIENGQNTLMMSANSGIFRLNKGDRVYIKCATGSGTLAGTQTSFTGFLVHK